MSKNLKVMLVTEGTYPFNGGGVSTWAQILCSETRGVDFTLYSVNAAYETVPKYTLPESIKEVIQVPLWTPDEPYDYISYGEQYYKTVGKKEWTTTRAIKRGFLPSFKKLLRFIYSDQQDLDKLDQIFKKMWLFFEDYDFKETMRNVLVWEMYRKIIESEIVPERNPAATMLDMTIGMRWMYRFLIPLAIVDVPKVDICHVTISGFPIIPALIAHYKYGSKIVLTEHGVFIRERLLALNNSEFPFFLKNLLIKFSEAIARLSYYKADRIISVNNFNRKWEEWYGADPAKIQVIYNGIDPDQFTPRPKPEPLKKIPTVVALARIFELKDILTMIQSCAIAKKEVPNVQYLVYGDDKAVPEYTTECLNLIAELGLKENFKIMGSRENAHLLFAEGDISILTSISEGFPYTVIESMASGVPVVATDVGGVKEALDPDSGFLCKPKDAQEIGEAVIRLLTDEPLRKKMSDHGRKRILENFTVDKFIAEYETVYQEIHALPRESIKSSIE
ncbi:GT4 family glycosyltransferase PelF [Nonlabens antarcticus]|uniref:GT4 family glycosyltransferase PelF n=1 Tax=Nonlabens antarcticus TaxID=392714 RepID=UPI001891952A|nr:GT4 family glycosyltransferase PelF [Nonlabens antarcticus]